MNNKKQFPINDLAYAKINLGLDVFESQFDYTEKHQIQSLFFLYKQMSDSIKIDLSSSNKDEIIYKKLDKPKNCLIEKTLNYLREKKLINDFYKIEIIKNIPAKSGLGGGSSDAACIVKNLCNDLEELDLLDLALSIGSDVPFFLKNYDCAIIKGFGEIIEPIKLNTNLNIKIHLTNIPFSTKEIFSKYNNKPITNKFNDYQKIIYNLNNNISNINANNILTSYVQEISFEWAKIYEELKSKHDFIIMSGSGGTIVTIDKSNNKIRTRYAPSPTGYFHIGGARTAIFNYLFAKHNNGDFIVRIEDTDTSRSVENGIESQINNLHWLGVQIDESLQNPNEKYGAYVQTQKLPRYQELAYKLLNEGKAYYCFCDEKQLEQDRLEKANNHETPKYSRRCYKLSQEEIDEKLKSGIPYVIRLKIDETKNYEWNDLIRGQISVPGDAMTDPVILKSNKIPMYNFAVVVDDYDMEITHVLRGEEHISNTPYQLAIKEALNFESSIKYGHLSIIVDETGKKLSKRNQTTKQFIEDYKNMGFLPEAVFNFLSLLSWSSETNQEILSPNELISLFDIDRLSKSPTFFDYKKMLWIGNEYFKKMSDSDYLKFVKPFIKLELNEFLNTNFDILALLFKNQISYADELNNLFSEFFVNPNNELNGEMKQIIIENKDVVDCFKEKIANIGEWSIENITKIIEEVKNTTNKKGKNLFMPIRIICTNLMHGPELAKIIFLKQLKPILFNIDKINLS